MGSVGIGRRVLSRTCESRDRDVVCVLAMSSLGGDLDVHIDGGAVWSVGVESAGVSGGCLFDDGGFLCEQRVGDVPDVYERIDWRDHRKD